MRGIDLSSWNVVTDYTKLMNDLNVEFIVARMNEWRGVNRWDTGVFKLVESAFDYDKPIGGYTRANPTAHAPEFELAGFLYRLDSLGLFESNVHPLLDPVIDIEPTGNAALDATVPWASWVREFIALWNYETQAKRLTLYMSGSAFDSLIGGVLDLPLNVQFWVGHTYKWAPGTPKPTPDAFAGKTQYTFGGRTLFHQFDDAGVIGGVQGGVDRNALMPYRKPTDLVHAP